MKAKITRGKNFEGIARYALSKDEGEIVEGNIGGTTPRQIAAEFEAIARLRPDIEKPVWHCSLSAAPGERLSAERWGELACAFLKEMSFPPGTQFTVIRHEAESHQKPGKGRKGKKGPKVQHVHIVVNRVSLDGKVWLGQNDVHRAIDATQKLEKQLGLVQTVGYTGRKPVASTTKPEREMAERKQADQDGYKPPRVVIQEALTAALVGGATIREFVERVQAAGVDLRPSLASTGRMNGFSFGHEGIFFTGQKLGDKFKWSSLLKSGLNYQPGRDTDFLRELAGQPAPAPVATTPSVPPVAAPVADRAPKANVRIQKIGKLPPRFRTTIPPGIAQWARDAIKGLELLAKALERFRQQLEASFWMHQQIQRIERARVAAQARAQIARQTAPKVAPAPAGPARSASQPQANPATAVPTAPSPAPIAGRPAEADPRAAIDAGRREAAERRIRLALQSGKGKSAALVDAVRIDDVGSLERLIEAGADPTASRGAALEAAAQAKRDDLFSRLLRGVPLQDHSDLQQLAQQVGPQAAQKLHELAKTAKAGGSLQAAGIEQPPQPEAGAPQVGTSTKLGAPS